MHLWAWTQWNGYLGSVLLLKVIMLSRLPRGLDGLITSTSALALFRLDIEGSRQEALRVSMGPVCSGTSVWEEVLVIIGSGWGGASVWWPIRGQQTINGRLKSYTVKNSFICSSSEGGNVSGCTLWYNNHWLPGLWPQQILDEFMVSLNTSLCSLC